MRKLHRETTSAEVGRLGGELAILVAALSRAATGPLARRRCPWHKRLQATEVRCRSGTRSRADRTIVSPGCRPAPIQRTTVHLWRSSHFGPPIVWVRVHPPPRIWSRGGGVLVPRHCSSQGV